MAAGPGITPPQSFLAQTQTRSDHVHAEIPCTKAMAANKHRARRAVRASVYAMILKLRRKAAKQGMELKLMWTAK
eukprot:642132-Heterocapsa_arctica.AAC.1